MEDIQRAPGEIGSMIVLANQMARKYGQIGNHLPEDIAQDSLVRFLRRTGDREPTRGWLYKTVRSVAYDAGRSYQRETQHRSFMDAEQFQSVCEHVDENGSLVTVGTYSPQREEDSDPDLMPRMKAMLQQLSEPLRDVLILYSEDFSYEEIAEKTRTKIGTVRSRIHYARKQARMLLGDIG